MAVELKSAKSLVASLEHPDWVDRAVLEALDKKTEVSKPTPLLEPWTEMRTALMASFPVHDADEGH